MRNIRFVIPALLLSLAGVGCEDGPKQVFSPLDDNAIAPVESGVDPFVVDGERGYGEGEVSGQKATEFCSEAELTEFVASLTKKPIVPDASQTDAAADDTAFGLPLWKEDGSPLNADDLLGDPEQDATKFCQPTTEYANAFAYGPLNDVIIFFNQETRLVEGIQLGQQYQGTLEAAGTVAGVDASFELRMGQKLRMNGEELNEYAGLGNQGERTRSWLNHGNLTLLHRALRQSFFGAEAAGEAYNCVAARTCSVIYTGNDDAIAQTTYAIFSDSGLIVVFSPTGEVLAVVLQAVRTAPFEIAGIVAMGDQTGFNPVVQSQSVSACAVDLANAPTWAEFKASCIDSDRTLARVNYNVWGQRDAVSVEFNGMTASFLRDVATEGVFRDGEAPKLNDRLFSFSFTRTLPFPVAQFVPADIVADYKTRLEASVHGAVSKTASPTHPLRNFTLNVPAGLSTDPAPLGEISVGDVKLGTLVYDQVEAAYNALSAAEKAQVVAPVNTQVFVVEPFVAAVASAFSFGASDAAGTELQWRTTDDEKWSLLFASWKQNGQPMRMTVQYSINFGGVTSISVGSGFSAIDDLFEAVNTQVRTDNGMADGYYQFLFSQIEGLTPFSLGAKGIAVGGFDRQLGTLDIALRSPATGEMTTMTVPGDTIEDRGGFMRQLGGERFEFIPADYIELGGKETGMGLYIDASGKIARVSSGAFKGGVQLCPGLTVAYGDDVRDAVSNWHAVNGTSAYSDCNLIFNYSSNGNVLNSVASITNRVSVSTVAGRAAGAAAWL